MSLKKKYFDMYSTLDYGPIITARGLMGALYVTQTLKPRKTLCVGSGNAYEAVWLTKNGFDVYTLDFHHPRVDILKDRQIIGKGQNIPFRDNTFDLVFCAECIEHIPEDEIDDFMFELKRVGTMFRFTVDTEDDPPYHSHLCIHDIGWWRKRFDDWGFKGMFVAPQTYPIQLGPYKSFGFRDRGFRFEGFKTVS